MTQALEMIAEVIEKSSQPGWVEYLAIGISLISVVVSGIAILFAVRVADKQNKIALFEKRYEVYAMLKRCKSFSLSLKETNSTSDIQKIFVAIFGARIVGKNDIREEIQNELTKYAISAKNTLDTASFLFSCDTGSYVLPITKKLFDILYHTDMANPEGIRQYKIEVQKMEKELLPQIERELSLLQ